MKKKNINSLRLLVLSLPLFIFLPILPLLSAQASFNPLTAIKNRVNSHYASKKLDALLRCEMKIINEQKGGIDGLYFVLDTLEKTKEALDDQRILEEIHNDCQVFLAQVGDLEGEVFAPHSPQSSESSEGPEGTEGNDDEELKKKEYLKLLAQLRKEKRYSETTLNYVESLVTPLIKCQAITANTIVGGGMLALAAGYGTGLCLSTQGESFFMAAPSIGFHFGGGATVSFLQQPIYFKLPKNRFHQGVLFSNMNAAVGLGLAADVGEILQTFSDLDEKIKREGRTAPAKGEIVSEVLKSGKIRGIAIGLGSTMGMSMGEAFIFPLFYQDLTWSKSLLRKGFNTSEQIALSMGEMSFLDAMVNGVPKASPPRDHLAGSGGSEISEISEISEVSESLETPAE